MFLPSQSHPVLPPQSHLWSEVHAAYCTCLQIPSDRTPFISAACTGQCFQVQAMLLHLAAVLPLLSFFIMWRCPCWHQTSAHRHLLPTLYVFIFKSSYNKEPFLLHTDVDFNEQATHSSSDLDDSQCFVLVTQPQTPARLCPFSITVVSQHCLHTPIFLSSVTVSQSKNQILFISLPWDTAGAMYVTGAH